MLALVLLVLAFPTGAPAKAAAPAETVKVKI